MGRGNDTSRRTRRGRGRPRGSERSLSGHGREGGSTGNRLVSKGRSGRTRAIDFAQKAS